jgi:hypothetical protein
VNQPDLFLCRAADPTGAIFSPNRVWRYTLHRNWSDDLPRIFWILLNPSTASETEGDPTIRRCIRFSKLWGFGGMILCNLFALRSTDPYVLSGHPNPAGDDNCRHIKESQSKCDKTVVAWGMHGHLHHQDRHVLAVLKKPLYCLGLTQTGAPRHPLYLRSDAKLVEFQETAA